MICAVIVAAGKGKRMKEGINKQYIMLRGKEVICYTLEAFLAVEVIDRIIVVTGVEEADWFQQFVEEKYGTYNRIQVVTGGKERQHSVYNGLKECPKDTDIVLIHDGARPFVSRKAIMDSIEGAKQFDACTVAVPVKDTVKRVNRSNIIEQTLDRSELFLIQTPQTFKYQLIMEAHEKARILAQAASDDTVLVEAMGVKVRIIEGDYFNIKLTTPEDLIFGTAILEAVQAKRDRLE